MTQTLHRFTCTSERRYQLMRRLLLLAGVWFAVDSALAKYDLGPVTAAAAAAAPRPSRAPMASSIADLPDSPVRRSLLQAISTSYRASLSWPSNPLAKLLADISSSSRSGSSRDLLDDSDLSWYTDSSSSSSSSSDGNAENTQYDDQQDQQQQIPSDSSSSSNIVGSEPSSDGSSSDPQTEQQTTNGGSTTGSEFLTVDNLCQNDDFNIAVIDYNSSWTWADTPTFYNVYFSEGWAAVRGLTSKQQIRPRANQGDSGQYVAVLRVKDGKWVTPKGSKSDSSSSGSGASNPSQATFDVSGSKRRACVLVGESQDRPYPRFRIVVKTDGDKVLANSVAAVGEPIFRDTEGVACEELTREPVLGYNYFDRDYTRGRLADVYDTAGYNLVIDDCSS